MERLLCSHFSVEVEELYLSDAPVILRVPVRRCRLAERMVARIAAKEEGQELARRITIAGPEGVLPSGAATGSEGAEAEKQAIRVAFGPDMDAIHALECTVTRCQESCTPSYQMLLRQFGFAEAAEAETGDGCLEARPDTGAADALLTPRGDL
jgi:hypothetical protein